MGRPGPATGFSPGLRPADPARVRAPWTLAAGVACPDADDHARRRSAVAHERPTHLSLSPTPPRKRRIDDHAYRHRHLRPPRAPVATGPAFWGPGDHYTFLVTGEESGGAYFAMEALVPPGGGPPPHSHTREDETCTPSSSREALDGVSPLRPR